MSLLYAWCNLRQNGRRTLAALAGLTFAVLLVYLQLGLLAAVRRATTQLYECFDFDVVVVSLNYRQLGAPGAFDRMRLMQADVVPGVAAVLPVGIETVSWTNPGTKQRIPIKLIGVPVRPEFLREPALRAQLETLVGGQTMLVDRVSRASLGDVKVGDYARINDQPLRLAGSYRLGSALEAEGGAFIEYEAWQRVTGHPGRDINFGLVRTRPGVDAAAVVRELRAVLRDDLLVFTREEFLRNEQDYFVRVKPLGIVFQIGAIVGCLAGAVMLFQVLATDVTLRLREYATLKAMGFGARFVLGVGLCQALLYLGLSAVAATGLAAGVFLAVRVLTTVPAWLDWPLTGAVVALVAGFGAISTGLALFRVRRADPAALFP